MAIYELGVSCVETSTRRRQDDRIIGRCDLHVSLKEGRR